MDADGIARGSSSNFGTFQKYQRVYLPVQDVLAQAHETTLGKCICIIKTRYRHLQRFGFFGYKRHGIICLQKTQYITLLNYLIAVAVTVSLKKKNTKYVS
jgi:hypothetical protein